MDICTASGEGLPVGTEHQGEDAAIRMLQGVPEGARSHIPQADGGFPIATSG